ncbi:MAG: hypothetical protein HW416_3243 [Chloroflexi bacterium]|nr:hypothetical protein [Chloroflexota bacterium]
MVVLTLVSAVEWPKEIAPWAKCRAWSMVIRLAVLTLCLAATVPAEALSQGSFGQTVSLSRASGPPGTPVVATAPALQTFAACPQVPLPPMQALWDGQTVVGTGQTSRTDTCGGFTVSFTVPMNAPAGPHTVLFREGSTISGTASFTVISGQGQGPSAQVLSLSPPSGPEGSSVVATSVPSLGAACIQIVPPPMQVLWDGQTLIGQTQRGSPCSDFSTSFRVPHPAAPGPHTVAFREGSALIATATFTVVAQTTAAPSVTVVPPPTVSAPAATANATLTLPEPSRPTPMQAAPALSIPGPFVVNVEPSCTEGGTSLVNISWTESPSADMYEVWGNGALLAEIRSRLAGFYTDAPSSVEESLEYEVIARNAAGWLAGGAGSVLVPPSNCSASTDAQPQFEQDLVSDEGE